MNHFVSLRVGFVLAAIFCFLSLGIPASAQSPPPNAASANSPFPMLVRKVAFTGKLTLPQADQDELAKELEGKTYNFDTALIQRVKNFWHEYGYWRVQVEAHPQAAASDGQKVGDVVFKIDEGAQYRLSEAVTTGELSFTQADLSALLLMKPGDIVSASRVQRGVGMLRGAYVDRGYSHAAVIPQIQFDEAKHTIAVHLDVDAGAKDSADVSSLECRNVVSPAPTAGSPYAPVLAYDPHRDALQDVEVALREAGRTRKNVFIEVGGDWCVWCHILDRTFQDHAELLRTREENFVTVYVNDDGQNTNEALFSRLPSMPDAPHVFVLDANGRLLASQTPVEWQDGKGYNPERIGGFLSQWSVDHSSAKCPSPPPSTKRKTK